MKFYNIVMFSLFYDTGMFFIYCGVYKAIKYFININININIIIGKNTGQIFVRCSFVTD